MQYAVIRSGGKQYKVSVGDTVTLDKLATNDKKSIVFNEVLLGVDEGNVSLGKPSLKGAKVEASLVGDTKGDKIRVTRFKAKSRYRRTIGFRAQQTVVKIDNIHFGSGKSERKASVSTKTAPKRSKK